MDDYTEKQVERRQRGLKVMSAANSPHIGHMEHINQLGDEMDCNTSEIKDGIEEVCTDVQESKDEIIQVIREEQSADIEEERQAIRETLTDLHSFVVEFQRTLESTQEEAMPVEEIVNQLKTLQGAFHTEEMVSILKSSSADVLESLSALTQAIDGKELNLDSLKTNLSSIETFLEGMSKIPFTFDEEGKLMIAFSEKDMKALAKALAKGVGEIKVYAGGSDMASETTLRRVLAAVGGAVYNVLEDDVSSTVSYFGYAVPGTATSAASWQIFKLDTSSGLSKKYAGGGDFTQIWDNRASLTYA